MCRSRRNSEALPAGRPFWFQRRQRDCCGWTKLRGERVRRWTDGEASRGLGQEKLSPGVEFNYRCDGRHIYFRLALNSQ